MVFVRMGGHRGRHIEGRGPTWLLSALALGTALFFLAGPATAADKKDDGEKSAEAQEEGDSTAEEPAEPADNSGEASGSVGLDTAGAAAAAAPTDGPGKTIVSVGVGYRSDLGLLLMRDTIGRFQQEEEFDVKEGGPMLEIGFLTHVFWKLRVGASLGYGFNFQVEERLTEFQEEQEQDPQVWVLGQLFSADIRAEFSQRLAPDLYLVVMPKIGIQAIDTGEAIREELRQYQDSHDTRTGLQLGLIGGIELGVRYMVAPWASVRATGGYAYYTQGLLRAKRNGDAADSDHLWRMTGARVSGNLAAEVNF